jgi:hypothetical protein
MSQRAQGTRSHHIKPEPLHRPFRHGGANFESITSPPSKSTDSEDDVPRADLCGAGNGSDRWRRNNAMALLDRVVSANARFAPIVLKKSAN